MLGAHLRLRTSLLLGSGLRLRARLLLWTGLRLRTSFLLRTRLNLRARCSLRHMRLNLRRTLLRLHGSRLWLTLWSTLLLGWESALLRGWGLPLRWLLRVMELLLSLLLSARLLLALKLLIAELLLLLLIAELLLLLWKPTLLILYRRLLRPALLSLLAESSTRGLRIDRLGHVVVGSDALRGYDLGGRAMVGGIELRMVGLGRMNQSALRLHGR